MEDLAKFGVAERLRSESGSASCGGINAVWKWRCGDFQVHEVAIDGKVIHLEEARDRRAVAQEVQAKRDIDSGTGVVAQDFTFSEGEKDTLVSHGCLTEEDINTLQEFIRSLARSAAKRLANAPPKHDALPAAPAAPAAPKSLVTEENPPHCILLGCKALYVKTRPEAGCEPKAVAKGLRKAIHEAIRRVCPYLSSQAIEISKVNQTYMLPLDSAAPLVEGRAPEGGVLLTRGGVEALRVYFPEIVDPKDDCNKTPLAQLLDEGPSTQVVAVFPKQLCMRKLILGYLGMRPPVQRNVGRGAAPKQIRGRGRGRDRRKPNTFSDLPTTDNTTTDSTTIASTVVMDSGSAGGLLVQDTQGDTGHDSTKEECTAAPCGLGRDFIPAVHDRWPKDRPAFLHFHMWKNDIDTSEAIDMIAACIGCQPRSLSVAGTKDKKAITVQAVTAVKVSMEQLTRAVLHRHWNNRVRVSNFSYRPSRLSLGELRGNLFRVTLRGIPQVQQDIIDTLCSDLAKGGFINYFGRQRFGSHVVPTHSVGVAMLKSEWQAAVRLILGDTEMLTQFGWTTPDFTKRGATPNGFVLGSAAQGGAVQGGAVQGGAVQGGAVQGGEDSVCAGGDTQQIVGREVECTVGVPEDDDMQNGVTDSCTTTEAVDDITMADEAATDSTTGGDGCEDQESTTNRKRSKELHCSIAGDGSTVKKAKHEPTSNNGESVQQYRANKRACRAELTQACLTFLTKGNATDALNLLPKQWHLEREILGALIEQPNDWLRALNRLPSNSCSLYIHAAQSLVWNLVVTWRTRRCSTLTTAVGDLVELEATHALVVEGTQVTVVFDPATLPIRPPRNQKANDTAEPKVPPSRKYLKTVFKVLTAEAANSIPITAVVHPLPGESVVYPTHLLQFYNEACKLIGLELNSFESKERHGMCTVTGSYRRILVVPEVFQWKLHPEVDDFNCPLAASDVDRLQGHHVALHDTAPVSWPSELTGTQQARPNDKRSGPWGWQQAAAGGTAQHGGGGGAQHDAAQPPAGPTGEKGKHCAVVVSCQLPKSSYFTMALRELLSDSCRV